VSSDQELLAFMRAIADGDETTALRSLAEAPQLATARLTTGATRATSEEFFLDRRHLQLYAGDTALHVAAASYDTAFARKLIAAGADVRARNRRGATPLHAAVIGVPGSSSWDPRRQAAVIRYLISAGAEPDDPAAGGVTPLHRAVRNRCSAAVRVLLDAGADRHRPNDNGSLAIDLARSPTGRGGAGSPEAKAEQVKILGLLQA
jgi:ankyrin repeat protein